MEIPEVLGLPFSFHSYSFPLMDVVETVRIETARLGLGDVHRVPIALRELLRNAIIHGNGTNSQKLVKVAMRFKVPEQVEIQVTDEGEGLDVSGLNLELPQSDPRRFTARGLLLAKHLSESLTFRGRGNQVVAIISTANPRMKTPPGGTLINT